MNNVLEIDMILSRKRYNKIYNITIIFTLIILISIYIIFTYKYQSYYISFGVIKDNKLELLVSINDLKYFKNNNIIEIDNQKYTYLIDSITQELYVDDNYKNYKYIYLKVSNLSNIDNYVYEVKIPKENKALVKYLKEYL